MESQSILYFLCRQTTCFMFVIILKAVFRFIRHQLGSRDSESSSFLQADQLCWNDHFTGFSAHKVSAAKVQNWIRPSLQSTDSLGVPSLGDPDTVLAPSVMMMLYQFPCANLILLSKMPLPCLLNLELLYPTRL